MSVILCFWFLHREKRGRWWCSYRRGWWWRWWC